MMTYDDIIASKGWRDDLDGLNGAIIAALDRFGATRELNGNLFYDHLQKGFESAPLLADCNKKRRRFFAAARQASFMFEVGVNGGHSAFLALSANHDLRVVGMDVCKQLQPTWGRVDIYVPAAMDWLAHRFGNDISLIEAESVVGVPQYALANPKAGIDLLHLDGDKRNYLRDFINIQPCLTAGAVIVIDDTNMAGCRRVAKDIVTLGFAEPHPDFPDFNDEKYQNIVLRAV